MIVVNQGSGVTAQDDNLDEPLAIESKNRAVTIIHNPKYVAQPQPNNQSQTRPDLPTHKPEQRPPSKPPNIPDKLVKQYHKVDVPRPHHGQIQKLPPPRLYPKQPVKLHHSPNSIYKFPRVIPLPPHHRTYYYKTSRPLVYAASTGKPIVAKSPKFSLPVQVINGIRSDFVRPPKINATTTTTTSSTTTEATTTTTQKVLRTKRIWPKRELDKENTTLLIHNTTLTKGNTTLTNGNTTLTKDNTTQTKTKTNTTTEPDRDTSESITYRTRFGYRNITTTVTTTTPITPSTPRVYRPVTRKLKVKTTTHLPPIKFTQIEPNDWVPILPSHYPKFKKAPPTPITKRSDLFTAQPAAPQSKQMMYLQSFGLVPVPSSQNPLHIMGRKKMVFFKRKRQLNPYYSGYSGKRGRSPMHYMYGDLESDGSHSHPRVVTKIKHHHHHHHHRYIKTVEKPVKVPYKVEVPKPYPVQVEKKVPVPVEKIKVVEKPVPYPVTVEKKVPYPIGIKIPHPVPVKVVEKEYVPKPYPIIHQVPVVKHVHVKVPYPVEKKVPYPVEVKVPVPVDRPVPVPVHVEKRVPYPVPVKVLVPQPYPVETKVPYPVQVKVREPVEVIKHVPIRVPYPQPYAVKVPHPVPVPYEKRVPYPVEVEKKVPVPVEVLVPQRVEVEKRVPVYVPKPYPVEKKVPYPVRVPYPVKVRVPVKVPVKVPVEVPVYIHHPYQVYTDDQYSSQYGSSVSPLPIVSSTPHHTVTVHGNTGFNGFQSRSDKEETTTSTTSAS